MLFKHSCDQGKEDNTHQLMRRDQNVDLDLKLIKYERFKSRQGNVSILKQNELSFLCGHVHSFTLAAILV